MRSLWLMLLVVAGCHATRASSGYPLYAKVGDGPGRDKVAMLYGPVGTVDGTNVSHRGQTFELLPGCHIVTAQRNVGQGSASGAWAANLGRMVWAFEMKAGHTYKISVDFQDSSSPTGRVFIDAREQAPNGSMARVPFASSDTDIEACRRWAAAQGL
jgi:hypothetical protein